MEIPENVILIKRKESDWWDETPWVMNIDLAQVAKMAGKREKDLCHGGSLTVYPIARARKLIQLILDNGTPEDFGKCEVYFRKNKKLYKWWQKYAGERGYDFSSIPDNTEIPFC